MLELFGAGIGGSLLGGLFRLAPELLKWLDRKNERAHELEMFKARCDLEKQQGAQKLAEIGAERDMAVDTGVLAALKAAMDQQTSMVVEAGKSRFGQFIAAASAAVRPAITYWLWCIYSIAQTVLVVVAVHEGMKAAEIAKMVLTPDFIALLSGVTNYWFLDRTLKTRGLA